MRLESVTDGVNADMCNDPDEGYDIHCELVASEQSTQNPNGAPIAVWAHKGIGG